MGTVKFQKYGKHIIVGATILNLSSLKGRHTKLLLDTGASNTVIDTDFIVSLGYQLNESENGEVMHTGSGTLDYKTAQLGSISVIGEFIPTMNIIVASIPDVLLDNGIMGLLGMDFLSQFDIRIFNSSGIIEIE